MKIKMFTCRLLLATCVICLSAESMAQQDFTVTNFSSQPKPEEFKKWESYGLAGVNLLLLTTDKYTDKVGTAWGGRVEFGARYFLNKTLFLRAGLGYEFHFSSSNNNDDYMDVSSKSVTHTLLVPLHVGFKVAPKVRLSVGPYLNYVVAGKTETTVRTKIPGKYSWNTDTKTTKISDVDDYNRFGLGLSLSINLPYIGIEAGYGLTERYTSGRHEAYVQLHFVFDDF